MLDTEAVDGSEASLAENVARQDLHPADQFEAFHALREGGMGIEDIAARFGVSAHTVRQRLRLAVVSPALIRAYREEALTEDQEAQERVFGQLQEWQRHPDAIRRLLTHALVPATDRRVLFVGLDAYIAAGGTVQRDLFSEDRGGWITDAALLERMVAERMTAAAGTVRAEGWKWVAIGDSEAAECFRLRRVWPDTVALTGEDEARRSELAARYDELAEAHNRSGDDLPEDAAAQLIAIERELDDLDARARQFRTEDVIRAGASLTLASDGMLKIERGFLRPEDEAMPAQAASDEHTPEGRHHAPDGIGETGTDDAPRGGHATPIRGDAEPEDKAPALSAALLDELEQHRTAGLQAAIAGQPELAVRVLLHALATDAFYNRFGETVASFHVTPPALACPSIGDNPARRAMADAEAAWRARLPNEHADLWDWLRKQDMPTLLGLLAVCVARTANAGGRTWTTPEGGRCVAARVATAAGLDMRRCWTPSRESYFGRVPKALILEAVREGAGAGAARSIATAKKEIMAQDAEALLNGTGWLPVLLRVPGTTDPVDSGDADGAPSTPLPMAAE